MAYYITKPSILTGETMYYTGNMHWSDIPEDKKTYGTKTTAVNVTKNIDGKSGGFTNATVLSE